MGPYRMNIVIGSTEFLATKHLAHAIGLAGTEQLLNSCVAVDFYTMNNHTPVTGPRMLMAARSIVSSRQHLIKFHPANKWNQLWKFSSWLNISHIVSHFISSTLQWRCKRKCSSREIMQPLLELPGRISTFTTLPSYVGIWQTIVKVCRTTNRGLCNSNHTSTWVGGNSIRSWSGGLNSFFLDWFIMEIPKKFQRNEIQQQEPANQQYQPKHNHGRSRN